jgi:hypothetical protein
LVADGGSAFISPGSKNVAGETDVPVLMPAAAGAGQRQKHQHCQPPQIPI